MIMLMQVAIPIKRSSLVLTDAMGNILPSGDAESGVVEFRAVRHFDVLGFACIHCGSIFAGDVKPSSASHLVESLLRPHAEQHLDLLDVSGKAN